MTRPNVSVIADSFLQGDAVIDVPFLCLSGRPNLKMRKISINEFNEKQNRQNKSDSLP